MSDELTTITADIVAAFVSHNSTRPDDMVELLNQVHGRLAEVMHGKVEPIAEAIVPAVSIKKSITHDAVYCLICGKGQQTLKRHIATSHHLDPAAYREMFGLQPDYSLTAPAYSQKRSSLAAKFGLGRGIRNPKKVPASEPSELSPTRKATAKTVEPVRSYSKADQTRRKSKASKKHQEAA